ncbi:MAG: glycosyltransferase [Bryobacterales bacterium]|nr:glycosyltransferase [Bryobacterales bacterium]
MNGSIRMRPAHWKVFRSHRGGPILLWVGRLEDEKNPIEFMKIGETLLRSGTEVRLLVAGDAYSNQEYAAYKQKLLDAVPEPWRNRFTFCQCVPHHQMPDVYSLAANSGGCLVSTSLYESAPMTFIEAMASLCPVISSNVGGVGEMLSEGVTGCLYNSGDVESAALKISGLLDPEQVETRRTLVERACAVVASRHAPGAVARKYVDLLESLPAYSPPAIPSEPAASGMIPGLVSTIIPVYNRAGLLREAVDSVLAQTCRNIEIVIVDDGSTDETAVLCDQLAREHEVIRALHIPHRGRAGLAREAGRRVARGEYIQYLDSDDLIMPEKFTKMVAALGGESGSRHRILLHKALSHGNQASGYAG